MQKLHKLFNSDPSPQKTAASPQQVPEDIKTKEQLLHEMGEAETDDTNFQKEHAKILRKLAIERLSSAEEGTEASKVSHEYANIQGALGGDISLFSKSGSDNPYPEKFEDFLKIHSKSGVWGTYLEAIALAEYFNFHLVVTAINSKGEEHTFALYKDKKPDAPIIHLYNSGNTHWSFLKDGSSTAGGGNCLYNAFAQALRYQVRYEQNKPLEQQYMAQALALPTPEKIEIEQHKTIVESQKKRLEELVGKIDKPGLVMQSLVEEGNRIRRLSPEEQKQLIDDYKYAVQFASEEIEETKRKSHSPA